MKPTSLALAEHACTVYYHSPEYGITIEDICKPSYWNHVARNLRPGNRIEVFAPDGQWWAMIIVRSASSIEASVAVLQHVSFNAAAVVREQESPYEVKWRGPTAKWSIVRKSDGSVVMDELQSKEIAEQKMKNHAKAMAA